MPVANAKPFRNDPLVSPTGSLRVRSISVFRNAGKEISDKLSHFSPLATFARERLLNIMIDRLDGMSETDRMEPVDQLAHEAMLAIDAEPENMELNFAVARFYRGAAEFEQDLMTQALYYTDKGISLGPNTASAALALEHQTEAEAQLNPTG